MVKRPAASSKTQLCIDFCDLEAETWHWRFPRKTMDMRQKQVGLIGVTGPRFYCSSPSTSEPLWYATASRAHVVPEHLREDRRLDRSADDFGLSAAKMRVEVRLKHGIRANPNIVIEKSVNRQNAAKNKEISVKKTGRLSSLNTSSNTSLHVKFKSPLPCVSSTPSSTKAFLTLTDKANVHNYGAMADGQELYVNPMFGASAEFQRRIAEMASLQTDTRRTEHAMRAKRKLFPSLLPTPSK